MLKMKRIEQLSVCIAMAALAAPALANEAALQKCRSLVEAAARLACYDAIPVGATAPTATTSSPSGAPVPSGRAAPIAGTAGAAPLPAPAAKTAEFGFEARAALPTTERIDSAITGNFEGWNPNSRIRLANGQVWQVTDGTARILDLMNPKVAVRRGAFGAFYLEIQGTNHSPRVRRVE